MILTPLQKLPNNVGDLGKIIVATSFEWLPKVQKIAKSGHTDYYALLLPVKSRSFRLLFLPLIVCSVRSNCLIYHKIILCLPGIELK